MNLPNLTAAENDPAATQTQRPRVLVVDDDFSIRQINSEILLKAGYDVDVAEDGAVAWDTLQLHTYDLLVTDNQMPKMTGLELVGKIRDANLPLPIVMATGTLPGAKLNQNQAHRPVLTLLKPYTQDELLDSVDAAMNAGPDGAGPVVLVPNSKSQSQVFGLRFN